MNKIIYHVSRVSGLKELTPKVSTHGSPYVYAIENLTTALLFGAKCDDFDLIISTLDNGKPCIYECYKDSLEINYKGVSASIYEVDSETFKTGMTSWNDELVSKEPVKVLKETIVNDLYTRLLEEEQKGNIIINRYSDNLEYKKIISKHIVNRLIKFDLLDTKEERITKHYQKIIDELNKVIDGNLL